MNADTIARDIGTRFAALVERAGISYSRADELALSRSRGHARQIAAAANGVPTLLTLDRYARVLATTALYLEHGVGEPPTDEEIAAAVERAERRARRARCGGKHASTVRATTSVRKAARPRSAARSAGRAAR